MVIECVLSDFPQHEMHFLSNGFLLYINGSEKNTFSWGFLFSEL